MAKRRIALAATAMLLASGLAVDARAQENVPFDHYLCYKATKAKGVPPLVTLIDQFDQAEKTQETVKPEKAKKLCAPLFEKNGIPVLFDPVIHLLRYPITSAQPPKTVQIINQFEDVFITTVKPVELMVPTRKNLGAPPPPPTGEEFSYEHDKCYTLKKSTFKKRQVTATDQFGSHILQVTSRTRLCNPVKKIVGEAIFPIRQPERHLVCYKVKPQAEPTPTVYTNSQFGPEKLLLGPSKVGPAVEICLPSRKILVGARKHHWRATNR